MTAVADRDQLLASARAGDVPALKRLAALCFHGLFPGAGLGDGVEALKQALAKGDAESAYQLCAAVAAGAGAAKDWPLALDYLGEAAGLGWAPARRQAGVLAALSDPALAPADPADDGADWRGLAKQIDVAAWKRTPPAESVAEAPRVFRLPALLPAPFCRLLIEEVRHRLGPATVYDRGERRQQVEDNRNNRAATFAWMEGGAAVNLVRERIAASLSTTTARLEHTTVLNYQPGQRFLPHFDYFDPALPGHAAEIAAGGQRIATVLIYLNDDYEAGGTFFPALGPALRGRPGDGLYFYNVGADGRPDPRSRHAGLAPAAGEKWIVSQFVREPRAP